MTVGDASRITESNTLIAGATQRHRKRNRDKPGLHCAEKSGDVIESLRRRYHGAVTR